MNRGNILVIAEKPSVAQAIAKVIGAYEKKDGYLEGSGYRVSWCFGHLAEYAMPEAYDERYKRWAFEDLPIVPDPWRIEPSKDKIKQVKILKKLLSEADCVVNACDAGREGELIFRHVMELAHSNTMIKRLWINSMEDKEIEAGFDDLKPGVDYEKLYEAAVCRAKADWLVGMNLTRGFSTRYDAHITVGRVQSPTLAMIVERQAQIENFVKEPFYRVRISGDGITAVSEKIKDEAAAASLAEKCEGKPAVVASVKREKKYMAPPKLFDLTTLQRKANSLFGYTAQQTLNELQAMYEAKLITYPRTDSCYVTEGMEDTVKELVSEVRAAYPDLGNRMTEVNVRPIINNKKVTDHHALLPTREALGKGVNDLPAIQKNLFAMICARLMAAVSEKKVTEEMKVVLSCEGQEFTASDSEVVKPGFSAIENKFRTAFVRQNSQDNKEKEKDDSAGTVPFGIEKGMEISYVKAEKTKHFTKPPKPYTEDTLLSAMERAGASDMDKDVERKGLGTPATRAGIIEKLISIGYVERRKKQLLPTEQGKQVVSVLPDIMRSAELTARWENMLLDVERGSGSGEDFLLNIFKQIKEVLAGLAYVVPEESAIKPDRSFERKAIGVCPACGADVIEGKKGFGCSNRECKFMLWKDNRFLSSMKAGMSRGIAEGLLGDGRVRMKGLYSQKKDKKFDADLLLSVDDDGRAQFSLEFPKRKEAGAR